VRGVTEDEYITHVLVWNVRGLNSRARRNLLRELVIAKRAAVVCLQETKLSCLYRSKSGKTGLNTCIF